MSTCPDPGDTTWVLVSCALVLGMMPGLAFFEAGLLRRKSSVSILTQVFVGLSLMNLLWWSFGFSLVYGHTVGG
ncbi:MAG: ammonia channel protein, partial [bacterium]